MTRPFRLAGIIAGLVLVGFGVGAIVIGLHGRSEVNADIQREHIVGSDDMNPALIAVAAKEAGLTSRCRPATSPARRSRTAPTPSASRATCASTRSRARAARPTRRCRSTRRPTEAARRHRRGAQGPQSGQPQSNPARETWISATALTTALNTSYFASSVATFAIVMGIALLLTGIGFIVLCAGLLGRSRPVKKPVVKRVAHELRTN